MKHVLLATVGLIALLLAPSCTGLTNANRWGSIRKIPKDIRNKVGLASVFLGGLAMAKSKFIDGPRCTEERVDMTGKNVVITGGNSGLGKETAVKLAELGATVTILCRDPTKATQALEEIRKRSGANANAIQFVACDLADLASIDRCAQELNTILDRIDVLVNNAGIMAVPTKQSTKDGFELQMGTNHLGHFALTAKLAQLLKKNDKSRVINVSSMAHLGAQWRSDDSIFTASNPKDYQAWPVYSNSKAANVLFTRSLRRRGINALSCHPGVCRTELARYLFDVNELTSAKTPLGALRALAFGAATPLLLLVTKSPEDGAKTQIYLSSSKTLDETNTFISVGGDDRVGKPHYFDNCKPVFSTPLVRDDRVAEKLWSDSERLTGVKFEF